MLIENKYTKTDISFSPNIVAGLTASFFPLRNAEFKTIQNASIDLLGKYVGKQFLDNTSNDKRKISGYVVHDVRVSYHWKPAFMKEISLSLLTNNIFGATYSSNGYTYGYLGGATEYRQNFYFPQAGRNYMVMVGLRF